LLKFKTVIRKFFVEYYKESINSAVFNISCVFNVCFPFEYAYRRNVFLGRLHPISKGIEKILNFFKSVGFTFVEGKEIEIIFYNFDALNIGKNHPAQSSSDTFYIENNVVLRTHTSAVQIREMEKVKPPLGLFTVGKVYRKDYDATHTPMFFQVEGLLLERNVSFGSLLCVLVKFLNFFFEQNTTKLRIRPSYFPFTEPSVEIDIICFFCDVYSISKCLCCGGSGWVEVLGAGMVHERVLEN
jgi:phenylalanyl-tRNA synthetase alpha chain